VAARLEQLLGRPVRFVEDCLGPPVARAMEELPPGGTALLENLRFHPGEEANDGGFAKELAKPFAVYVGDAFGAAHRAHASMVGVAKRLPRRAAGRLMAREVEALGRLLREPPRPFVAILGGAKIGGKIDILTNLLPRLDALLLGGGMANTFLAAAGRDMADSLVEEDRLALARQILDTAQARGILTVLPDDLVVTPDLQGKPPSSAVVPGAVPAGHKAVDIGPRTHERFAGEMARAATLFWNGPLGVFEIPPFDQGTRAVAESLARCDGFTVVGGGETVAAVRQAGVAGQLGHVSTGGGASLEFLAGKELPGLAVLRKEGHR
jgi:phosphoglycerate kinase